MNKENNKISKVILNLIQDLQRLLGSFSNGVRGRCQIKFGMTSYVKGFTLMEILVVVVIIAILATVAVSAYQRAVVKSRFSALMPMGKALRDGNEAYYLEHGSYATEASKLDVTSSNPNAIVEFGSEPQRNFVQLTRDDMHNNLVLYQKQSPNFPGEIHCEAEKDNALANWLCKDGLKGTLIGEVFGGYNVYSLDENYNGTLARTYYNGEGKYSNGDICIATQGKGCWGSNFSDGAKCMTTPTAGWYACSSLRSNHNVVCEGNSAHSCGDAYLRDHSRCLSGTTHTCQGVVTWDYSSCEGNYDSTCSIGFMDNHSICYANASGACNYGGNPVFGGKMTNNSSCIGQADNTCTGLVFKTNSTCVANAVGACVGSTYEDSTSYCTGKYCPEGAASNTAGKVWHREEGWDAERESVLVDLPAATE